MDLCELDLCIRTSELFKPILSQGHQPLIITDDEIPNKDKRCIFEILFENSNVTLNFDRLHLSIWSNDHLELMVSLLKSFWVVPVARCWHEAARRDPNEAFSRFFFAS